MRVLLCVTLALLVGTAMANSDEGESDSVEQGVAGSAAEAEAEAEHPTLPALGSACNPKRHKKYGVWRVTEPKVFQGVCKTEGTCAPALSVAGHCAGIGITCCKSAVMEVAPKSQWVTADVVAPKPKKASGRQHRKHHRAGGVPSAAPKNAVVAAPTTPVAGSPLVLKSGVSMCQSKGGVCKTASSCVGTTQSGMCPGNSSIKCCFARSVTPPPTKPPTTPPAKPVTPPVEPAGMALNHLIPIPSGINRGVSLAGASFLISKIGKPGCALTPACFNCNCAVTNALIKRLTITATITPNIRITGLKPYVEAVQRAFAALKAAGATNPGLMHVYTSAKTAGGLCCRPIKHANGSAGATWSNHSWGCAADFYFGPTIDPRGDGKCQYGLSLLAPFMNAEKLYWAAGYKGSEEDAMHFETSQESMNSWIAQGLLK